MRELYIRTTEHEHIPYNVQYVWCKTRNHQTLQHIISMISSSTLVDGALISEMSSVVVGMKSVCFYGVMMAHDEEPLL